ncbi:threonine/serine exporter family protein [Clostridium oryzae]|uniref:Threonine/Serine exporter ThrE domain-containing protein n=1 Tax=Clostridium oryzae TaxID=1450648 RepID=A0A1V4IUZ0_9CLOT|nr:threonine/serine exporter family protein [Clostridium oryzae]OPJ63594.1 hypothetical protein CLORY_11020 [Clostridium oryzae]
MILKVIYAMLATLFFCVLFNIRGKNLIYTSIGGGIGWFVYLFMQSFSLSITMSMFVSSIFIAAYSEIMARINKAPVTTFIICSLLPIVPGGGMYYTSYELIKGNVTSSLHYGIQTLMSAGALSIGILLVASVSRILHSNVKRTAKN